MTTEEQIRKICNEEINKVLEKHDKIRDLEEEIGHIQSLMRSDIEICGCDMEYQKTCFDILIRKIEELPKLRFG